jgi:hypothetical protein
MARGFESKSVEAQQEEAARGRHPARPDLSPDDRRREQRRRLLELTRARVRDDLARATAPTHKHMLEEALAALDRQMQELQE